MIRNLITMANRRSGNAQDQSEGMRGKSQEWSWLRVFGTDTWFGERVDPEFAEKRDASQRSTRRRRKAAS
jgi:hypothetical protein